MPELSVTTLGTWQAGKPWDTGLIWMKRKKWNLQYVFIILFKNHIFKTTFKMNFLMYDLNIGL